VLCQHPVVEAVWAGVVAGVLSGVAAAGISGFVTLRKVRSDLVADYDKDLRARRLEHYLRIWPEFAPLATTKTQGLTKEELGRFSDVLRQWYFTGAGVYFSRSAMDVYNILQREIANVADPDHALTEREVAVIRFFASSLRTRMTEDLGTRRRPLVFGRSRLADRWRRMMLYHRAERAASNSGDAGPGRRKRLF
jgi:hypothetical protein